MELLVFARNNTNPNADKDISGCYKRGMIVGVHEDGHTWGRLESKQQWIAEGNSAETWPSQDVFVIVQIPGVPAQKARMLLDEQTDDDSGTPVFITNSEGHALPRRFRRRGWRLKVDDLPSAARTALIRDGEITVTVSEVRTFIRRIRDDAQYTGLD